MQAAFEVIFPRADEWVEIVSAVAFDGGGLRAGRAGVGVLCGRGIQEDQDARREITSFDVRLHQYQASVGWTRALEKG